MTTSAIKFINLQEEVNDQIDFKGQADQALVNELEILVDSLNQEEMDEIMAFYESHMIELDPPAALFKKYQLMMYAGSEESSVYFRPLRADKDIIRN